MQVRTMRLMMGVLFLCLAFAIFCRQWLFPEFAAGYDPLRMSLGGVFALVFGGVNLVRWYTAWSFAKSLQTPVHYPLTRDPSTAPKVEPLPEFDFTKQPEGGKVEGQGEGERKQ
jgi:hypothetical protein